MSYDLSGRIIFMDRIIAVRHCYSCHYLKLFISSRLLPTVSTYVDGVNTYPAKNDRGYDWWLSKDGGSLVLEDPKYCAEVSFNLGDWIDVIIGNKANTAD